MKTDRRPPWLATKLLARFAPEGWPGASLMADLQEELRRRRTRGALRAWAWYWRAVLQIAAAYRRDRAQRDATLQQAPERRAPGGTIMGDTFDDIGFALRSLRRSPGFAVATTLVLGIGIGATTAIFSVVNAVVLRPLPYPEPERLIRIYEVDRTGAGHSSSDPDFLDFRAQNRTFEDLATISLDNLQATLLGEGEPERLSSAAATGSLFSILRVEPVLGRNFSAEEQRHGGDSRVVLLSHRLWQQRFAGDPAIVGKKLNLDGEAWTVVGVLPAGFRFFTEPDLWRPFVPDPEYPRGDHRIELFGRLRDGATLDEARADMEAIAARLSQQYASFDAEGSVELVPFPEWLVGPDVEQVALVLAAAVVLLLLVACANVSNLLIAWATGRRQEMGLRVALGAARARIVRQLLVESFVLVAPGAALGLGLALWTVPTVATLSAGALPRIDEMSVDGAVLAFALAASLLNALVFAGVASVHVIRGEARASLASGDRTVAGGSRRLRDGLVVAQLALAMMLLVEAGLLTSSFVRLQRVDPGFDATNVLTVEINLPVDRYPESSPEAAAFYRDVLERIESLPQVRSAAATMVNPFRGWDPSNEVATPEIVEQSGFVRIHWRGVTHRFFETMGVTLLRGRAFEENEPAGTVPVVIDSALADRLWPGEDPTGRQVRWNSPQGPLFTVVGVVAPLRDRELQTESSPTMYVPQQLLGWPHMTLLVKTAGDPVAVAAALRSEVWDVDPKVPVPEMLPLRGNLEDAVAGPRFNVRWMGLFAFAALSMASMGIYGVISYSVARRTREIGIRLALGARPTGAMRMVLSDGLRLVVIGVLAGSVGAIALSPYLEGMLFQTDATQPAIFVIVAAGLALVAMLATWVPARRATRVDAMVALRGD